MHPQTSDLFASPCARQRLQAFADAWRARAFAAAAALAIGLGLAIAAPPVAAQSATEAAASAMANGPIRLRQPVQASPVVPGRIGGAGRTDDGQDAASTQGAPRPGGRAARPETPPRPTDFEFYVQNLPGGEHVRRFGADLLAELAEPGDGTDYNPLVPPDYLLRAGDELIVTLWGSVDADLRLQVDRSGRITIPRVGPVMVSGVRYGDLTETISRRVGQVFKNYQISVSLGQLRGIRVYVTGYVNKPGALMVNSLSTLAQALLRAGGPSAAGSFRQIQLRRGRDKVTELDLYALLLRGDRTADTVLQSDDVIHVQAVGRQVAILGSVNQQGIFELRPDETVADLLRLAGGFNAVADGSKLTLDRFADAAGRLQQLELPAAAGTPLRNGDVLRALNAAAISQPTEKHNKRVRVEGEVAQAGEYVLKPNSTLADALRMAGGPSVNAYLYGTEFTRESVRITQQRNYERALRDLETQLGTTVATRRTTTADEASALAASDAANNRLVEQLRLLKPNGRIVLQLQPNSQGLPELPLEDGDRIYVPPRPSTVGVFGSVFSAGSFLHAPGRTIGDYLRLAGGPTIGADASSVFVIRANGTVSSSLQEATTFSRGNRIAHLPTEPGDTIFVPEEMNKTTWVQNAKDWTQILYQFGIGLAGMKSAVQ